MYVQIQNPDGSRETATEGGQCFREAFEAVIEELKKGAVRATIYAENPTDAQFGNLGEHVQFKGAALPLMTFTLGEQWLDTEAPQMVTTGEVTSPEVASIAGRILQAGNPLENEQVKTVIMAAMAKGNVEGFREIVSVLSPYMDNMLSIAGSALTQRQDKVADDRILLPVEIDYGKVANAIVGAIESGYSPWFSAFRASSNDLSQSLRNEIKGSGDIWYAEASYWQRGGSADLAFDLPDGEEGEMQGQIEFGKAEIQRGLAIMAAKYPRHLADLLSENDDATTHDVFMQCAILEDVIYG
jgi:hypothetical protein